MLLVGAGAGLGFFRNKSMIDRTSFFSAIRASLFKDGMRPQVVSTIDKMLDYWEANFQGKPLSWLAYTLATAYHETARTFGPIEEFGKGRGKRYKPYYGRGLVQLTWDYNYKKMGDLLGLDLVGKPELALDVDNAVPIIFIGMRDGLFTGKSYSTYLTAEKTDYTNARRIINGTDKAKLIADYATQFEAALVEASKAPVVEATTWQLGWFALRIKNFLKSSLVSLGTLFTMDFWGLAKDFAQQLKDFGTSTRGLLLISLGILAVWLVIEYLEKQKNAKSAS